MTAVPKDRSLGLIRCMRKALRQKEPAIFLPNLEKNPAVDSAAFCDARPTATPVFLAAPHGVTVCGVCGATGAVATCSAGIVSVFSVAASGKCSMVGASGTGTGPWGGACGGACGSIAATTGA